MSIEAEAKRLFQAARDKPAEQRTSFLDEACEDATLRARIEALLAAHDELGAFLADPDAEDRHPDEGPGAVVDRYKLLQQIGEGGFGVVYMAEQIEPVRRKVALKVLKPGMDTKQVIARFEAERQALALMEHPNIARVLDAGTTRRGHPYFVMELVKGVPITQYADEAKLDTRERLKLFQPVCHAIQHAHQKGIIHRDLKPSNILVTLHDGRPVPKVIDFGIAKATDHRLTEKTLFTEFRQMVGTPEYMAPEQAELSGLDIDTRADIYSLGVLLYEILTGKKPFDFETLMREGYGEILRYIREVDPPKPSTRVSTLGADASVLAHNRHTEPKMLGRLLRGDLDWIVMRALEKDRNRRYETANALAMDVERFLSDQAVVATPPSAMYRARKYVRRHRAAVVATGLVTAALLVGLVVSTTAWVEADRQRERAEAREREARTEAQRATTVVGLMKRLIGAADPDEVRGANFTVKELLDEFDRELDPAALADQPEVAATIHGLLGGVYVRLGLIEEGQRHLDLARKHADGVLPADHEVLTDALVATGRVLDTRGRWAEAQAAYRKALELTARRVGLESAAAVRIRNAIVGSLLELVRVDEAQEMVTASLTTLETVDAPREHIQSLVLQGGLRKRRGDLTGAEREFRKALAIAEQRLPGDDPRASAPLRELALVLAFRGEREAALEMARRALAFAEEQYGEHHSATGFMVNGLYLVVTNFDMDEEGLALARRDLAIKRRTHGESSAFVGVALGNVALSLERMGRHEEARPILEEGVMMQRAHWGEHPEVVLALSNLAYNAHSRGDDEAAIRHLDEAFEMADRILPAGHPTVGHLHLERGRMQNAARDWARAEASVRKALEIYRRAHGRGSPRAVYTLSHLVRSVYQQGRIQEARSLAEEAGELARASQDPMLTASVLSTMGVFVSPAEGVRLCREALEICTAVRGSDHPVTWDLRMRLASALHGVENHAEAAEIYVDVLERMDDQMFGGFSDESWLHVLTRATDTLLVTKHPQAAKARAALERRLKKTPRGWAFAWLGGTMKRHGSLDESRRAYSRARELLDPEEESDLRPLSKALYELAGFAHDRGDRTQELALMAESIAFQRKALAWLEREMPGELQTLRAKLDLADRLHVAGDDAAAAPLFVEVLPKLETLLPKPAERAKSLGCALVAVQAGSPKKDVDAVVTAFARVRKEHFPECSAGCCGQPRRMLAEGRTDDAVRTLRGVLRGLRAAYDKPGRDILNTVGVLVAALKTQGDAQAARTIVRSLREEARTKLGDHAITAEATAFLAFHVELSEQLELLEEAVAMSRRVQGATHANTRLYERHIAMALAASGRHEEAAPLFASVLPHLAKLNPDPESRRTVLLNATLSLVATAHPEASAAARELVALTAEVSPDADLENAGAQMILGRALFSAGELTEAVEQMSNAVATLQDAWPAQNPELLGIRLELAAAYDAAGQLDASRRVRQDVLTIAREHLGEHALVAAAAHQLSFVAPPKQAVELAAEAAQLGRRLHGAASVETRMYETAWAVRLAMVGEQKEAAQKFAPLLEQLGGLPVHPEELCLTLRLAASALVDAEHPKAERAVTLLRETQERCLGADDPNHAVHALLAGVLTLRAGKAKVAEALLRRAVSIREKALPADHWLLANVRSILGEALTAQRKFDEAESMLLEAYEKIDPPEPWGRRKKAALERIIGLYEAWGKTKQADTWRKRLVELTNADE